MKIINHIKISFFDEYICEFIAGTKIKQYFLFLHTPYVMKK